MTDKDFKIKGWNEASDSLKAALITEIDKDNREQNVSTEEDTTSITGVSSVEEKQQNLEGDRETLFYFELDNITRTTPFVPEDPSDRNKTFPVNASGQLDSILVIADSDDFSATVEVDDNTVLDNDAWQSIEAVSQELPHIGAYERRDGGYVLSISDYVFNDHVDFSLRPDGETTFETIRVEIIVDELNEVSL